MTATKPARVDSVILNLRITPSERDALDGLAKAENRSRTSFVRNLIAERISGFRPDPQVIEQLKAKIAEHETPKPRMPADEYRTKVMGERCGHPITRRIGSGCGVCGETVKVGK